MHKDDEKKSKVAKRLQEIRERGILRRTAEVVAESVNLEARTVELSFSSETDGVERWFGIEILDHSPAACDLSRLNNKAPVLWMHDWTDQRGVVESARIDTDRKGRAVVRFSKSDEGEELLQDIADGIVTKVSVGYSVDGLKWIEDRSGTDVYLATSWQPYEISMVSVPADDDVGVGRSLETVAMESGRAAPQNPSVVNQPGAIRTMNEKITRDASGNLVRAKVDEHGKIVEILEVIERAGADAQAAQARGADGERARVRAITSMAKQYKAEDLALDFVGNPEKTPEDFQRAILDREVATRTSRPLSEQERAADIGLTNREQRKYSLLAVVRALANPTSAAAQKAAAFEIECSRAAAEKYGKEARGIIIPQDVLSGVRSFNAGTNGQVSGQTGGNLVANHLLSGSFIEMLRNQTTIMRMARVMGGLTGTLDIPKQTGGATAYWLGEGEDATEGAPVIGQIGMAPKTIAAYTDLTRKLMLQSTPDAEAIVWADLIAAMGLGIDKAGYYGSGVGDEPKGIKNYAGVNAVDFAAVNPTHGELVDMETAIAADNAAVDNMAYVANSKFRGYAKQNLKFAAAGSATIWEPGNTVNGYRAEVTNQIADGEVFHGNFADLIVGLWGGLDLTVDTSSLSLSGGTRVVVFQDADFAVRRVESFCFGKKPAA